MILAQSAMLSEENSLGSWFTSQRQKYLKITDPEQILGNQDTNAQDVLFRFSIFCFSFDLEMHHSRFDQNKTDIFRYLEYEKLNQKSGKNILDISILVTQDLLGIGYF